MNALSLNKINLLPPEILPISAQKEELQQYTL
jgi:hypothetical protein